MKSIICLLLASASLALVPGARADGLPVDTKTRTITADHLLFDVSEYQAEEMDTQGTLTLTKDQWKTVREKKLGWPMRIDTIINYDEGGCSCGTLGPHVIRLSERKVGILYDANEYPSEEQLVREALSRSDRDASLHVDRRGQF